MVLDRRRPLGARIAFASIAFALAAALAGCTGSDGAPASASDELLATTTIWADITSHVACGTPVSSITPSGADPHGFEPSLQDRARLESAGTIIANGGGLEESLTDLLATIGSELVEITPHIDLLTSGDGDGHDGADPHIWQDPTRVAGALGVIVDAVVAAGRDRAQIEACAATYRAELEQLDTDVAALLQPIPEAQRVLVTNHDAFAYFADRYGFEVVGTVIPSTSTIGDSSAGQLAELATVIEQRQVPAIFTEQFANAADAEALADRLGVAVVPLTSDALTEDGPGSTYIGMLRANAEAIAAALA